MSKSQSPSVTIEEAVARMVSLDYLPEGFTVQDITSAFLEDAENDYEDGMPGARELQAIRANVCEARHELAKALSVAIDYELNLGDESMLVRSDDSNGVPRVTMESLSQWAGDRFGIGAPEWESWNQNLSPDGIRWEDVTIKIYADYRIGCQIGVGNWKQSSFREIGLMGKRKVEANELGGILLGLSQGKRYPPTRSSENRHAAAISKLRKSLCQLTRLSGDPFIPFNIDKGWKPRFTLIDERRNADERAKTRAVHVEFDATIRDFDDDDDPTGKWINENS